MDIEALRAAVREAGIDGWLLYDFRRSNPIAHRVLGLSQHAFFSRRWCYYVPADGEPTALVSAVESHVLSSLPGRQRVYRTWQEYRAFLGEALDGARRVAMEYSPECANPYIAKVDAGTIELVRALGPEVVSTGDIAQRFEAVLTQDQIATHRAAGAALVRAGNGLLAWLREQLLKDADLTEYSVQHQFGRLMAAEGLAVDPDDLPLVAV
ncbi:MAG TPA: hypothetical protein VGS80_00370, partial [Ktedonobacterales bacterium]|nr:hypothetical protein [Ktedonobacterales bacterium]